MTSQSKNLLTKNEYHALYAALSPSEVSTVTLLLFKQEEAVVRCFRRLDLAVYYAINFAFFKIKQSFVKISYRDVTAERQLIMQHYFPNQPVPRGFPSEQNITLPPTLYLLKVFYCWDYIMGWLSNGDPAWLKLFRTCSRASATYQTSNLWSNMRGYLSMTTEKRREPKYSLKSISNPLFCGPFSSKASVTLFL